MTTTLPMRLLSVLVALLLASQVLARATHTDDERVCLTDPAGNFCANATLDLTQVEIR